MLHQPRLPGNQLISSWLSCGTLAKLALNLPRSGLVQQLDQPLVYLQAGWFPNDATRDGFIKAAQQWAPTVRHLFVNGRDPDVRKEIWHAADIFCSLSDNFQETFGLTPIEAMAAGLPVVVSDWNGYRDTVRNGIDGFLIPTTMPESGSGPDLSQGYCAQTISQGHYWAVTAQTIAVDLQAATQAIIRLAQSADLRWRQSKACRRHVEDNYDWKNVIAQLSCLLDELSERRTAAMKGSPAIDSPRAQPAPLRGDPYQIFAGYPTAALKTTNTIEFTQQWEKLSKAERNERLKLLREDCLHEFANTWRLSHDETIILVAEISGNQPLTINDIMERLNHDYSQGRNRLLITTLSWLMKLGVLQATAVGSK